MVVRVKLSVQLRNLLFERYDTQEFLSSENVVTMNPSKGGYGYGKYKDPKNTFIFATNNIFYSNSIAYKFEECLGREVDLPASVLELLTEEEIKYYNFDLTQLPTEETLPTPVESWSMPNKVVLKDYQQIIHDQYLEHIKKTYDRELYDDNQVRRYPPVRLGIVAPCGMGKTIMGLSVARSLNHKAVIVLKVKNLMKQWLDTANLIGFRAFTSTGGIKAFKNKFNIRVTDQDKDEEEEQTKLASKKSKPEVIKTEYVFPERYGRIYVLDCDEFDSDQILEWIDEASSVAQFKCIYSERNDWGCLSMSVSQSESVLRILCAWLTANNHYTGLDPNVTQTDNSSIKPRKSAFYNIPSFQYKKTKNLETIKPTSAATMARRIQRCYNSLLGCNKFTLMNYITGNAYTISPRVYRDFEILLNSARNVLNLPTTNAHNFPQLWHLVEELELWVMLIARCVATVYYNEGDKIITRKEPICFNPTYPEKFKTMTFNISEQRVLTEIRDVDKEAREYDLFLMPDKHLSSPEVVEFVKRMCPTMLLDESHTYNLLHDSHINRFMSYNDIRYLIALTATPSKKNNFHIPRKLMIPEEFINQSTQLNAYEKIIYHYKPMIKNPCYDDKIYAIRSTALKCDTDHNCDGYLEVDTDRTDYILQVATNEFNSREDIKAVIVTNRRSIMTYIAEQLTAKYDKDWKPATFVNKSGNLEEYPVNDPRRYEGMMIILLDANMSEPNRVGRLDYIRTTKNKFIMVSTQQYIGTGLDVKSLNTLFIHCFENNKSQVIQVTGRIERENECMKRKIFIFPFITLANTRAKVTKIMDQTVNLLQSQPKWDYQCIPWGICNIYDHTPKAVTRKRRF